MIRIPSRIRNHYFVRDREADEVTWVRPGDFETLVLPGPVVLANGAFDVLHSGHMKVLFQARERAGSLVVALDSDARVARKGPGRPIQTFIERATAMNYMPVDYLVEIESDRDMYTLIRTLRPDLRVQGYDYEGITSKYAWIPKMYVRGTGMRTSTIINRIKERIPADGR